MKFLKDGGIYVLGGLLSKAIPFLLLPYLTRMLGPSGYGELAYYQVFILFVAIFVGMSQQAAITRYYYFYGEKSIGLVVSTGLIYSVLIISPLVIYSLITKNLTFFFISLTALSQILLSVQLSLRQCQKKALEYFYIQFTTSVCSVTLTILLFETLNATYQTRLLAILAANLIAFAIGFFSYKAKYNLRVKFNFKLRVTALLYLFSFGVPLILHQLSFFAKGQIDRFFVYQYFEPELLGIYSAAFQIASILTILLGALNSAYVPYFYEGLKNGTIDRNKIQHWLKISLICIPIPPFIAFLLPENLYLLVLGSDFYGAKYFVCVFLIGLAITIPYLILVNYLLYVKRNKQIALSSVYSAVVYILLIYIFTGISIKLIPFALVISNICMTILVYYYYSKISQNQLLL
jgi:O-antigen/teichoic acid export membrane protein